MSNKKALAVGTTLVFVATTIYFAYEYYSTKGTVVEYIKKNTTATSIPNTVLPASWTKTS